MSDNRKITRSCGDDLAGRLLIASPTMTDPRFNRAVILMCTHSPVGAMGIVTNQAIAGVDARAILAQTGYPEPGAALDLAIRQGGPVQPQRGFVLHSTDYEATGETLKIGDQFALTASATILADMVAGTGPRQRLLALGYAGWGEGQLDRELREDVWLVADASPTLVFETPPADQWALALRQFGPQAPAHLGRGGHA